jgi:hypothetical protein
VSGKYTKPVREDGVVGIDTVGIVTLEKYFLKNSMKKILRNEVEKNEY